MSLAIKASAALVCLLLATTPAEVASPPPAQAAPQTPPALSLACPATVTVQASDITGAVVSFAAPTSSGGMDPVTVSTAPRSGSRFAIGTATVAAEASDAAGQKVSCTFTVTVTSSAPAGLAPRPALPPPAAGTIFSSGFDDAGPLGCTLGGLLQSSTSQPWTDFGPRVEATCTAGRVLAEIVEGPAVDGTRSLQVNFRPDGSENGPDYRVAKGFGGQREIYARWYTQYSKNWVFAGADHKVAIFGNSVGSTQDVYFNIRGNGNGPVGRPVIHIIPSESVFSDDDVKIRGGEWILFEIHIVCGPGGRVEAKINGRQLKLRNEAGDAQNINKLNPCSGNVDYIKLDTTYNAYSYPSRLKLTMQMWYDAVAVATSGWIGAVIR